MNLLITGSGGRVGRPLYVRLAREHRVEGLDRSPSSTVHHAGELSDAALLARALDGVEAVLHVAALHAPHVGWASEAVFERVNVEGTATTNSGLAMLKAMKEARLDLWKLVPQLKFAGQ